MRILLAVTALGLAALLLRAAAADDAKPEPKGQEAAEPPAPKSPVGFVKGYTWGWVGRRGSYEGPEAAESMKHLAETGAEWVTLAFAAEMETKSTPRILYGAENDRLVTDAEIRRAIGLARASKLKVILKPVVNCRDGTWRAKIDFPGADGKPDPKAWAAWWESFEKFLVHYATIAAEGKCELLCVGCEMISTERFVAEWRQTLAKVREVYKGPLIYNCNHGHEDIAWWDAVDVVGVSAYYPVGTEGDSSLEAMMASWQPLKEKLRNLSRKVNRPVMFIEIGVRSARGCYRCPADYWSKDLPYDGQEQARYYEAALRVFWDEPWFAGYSWWDWPARLHKKEQAESNLGFCVYGKPAEQVLRTWYAKERP
ncbi:MAG: glycosyl hydrolase family 53 [Planctomycetes bacterium]|nr:glycosyl hydrolase family 53 [Planctomycetota bacterium]